MDRADRQMKIAVIVFSIVEFLVLATVVFVKLRH